MDVISLLITNKNIVKHKKSFYAVALYLAFLYGAGSTNSTGRHDGISKIESEMLFSLKFEPILTCLSPDS